MSEDINLNSTPSANRTHIVFLGKMNSGKSSLINALAHQEISIVSECEGTTTDPVRKSMEIHGIGPCILIDTAGFDDKGELGDKRVTMSMKAASQADVAVILITDSDLKEEKRWLQYLHNLNTPVITVINKADTLENVDAFMQTAVGELGIEPIVTSTLNNTGIDELRNRLIAITAETAEKRFITGNLVKQDDIVLLVMPQDIQAPEGRLILPQVQTIRELLDRKCIVISVTTDKLRESLNIMKKAPKLIITDSQVYKEVYKIKPDESMITSFSTLFAAYKGDIDYYISSADMIGRLDENSKVLIAECCTHAPLAEDIGREKIPALLRKRVGNNLKVDVVSGKDFPENLSEYQLVIQCGACMFNRKYVMSRIESAKQQKVPVTNYGIAIAWINGILDNISVPMEE